MYYVYVLKNNKRELYVGYTADLRRRVSQHKNKKINFQLIYYESYSTEKLARSRERKLKYYGSAWRSLKKRVA